MSSQLRKFKPSGPSSEAGKSGPVPASRNDSGKGPGAVSALREKVAQKVAQDPAKAAKILSLWISSTAKSKK
jgi:hypothetical protein